MNDDFLSAALAEFARTTVAEQNDPTIDECCRSFIQHHGHRTDRAIVLFHGFTNCPRQFVELANLFFRAGFNVYVPRLPRHGLRDKLTTVLEGLTVEEVTECALAATRLGSELGTRLSVMGLSLGATIVAWLAQSRRIDSAIAIAPFFSVVHLPALLEPALAATLTVAPNVEIWWDPQKKERAGPAHGYPRFATHALARCLELGQIVSSAARHSAPLCGRNVLVLNAKDPAIDNNAARDVWKHWHSHGGTTAEYIFDDLDARHDIIEPTTYPQAATLVYPVLLQLVGIERHALD